MKLVEKEIRQERLRIAWRVFAFTALLILLVITFAQGLLYLAGLRLAIPSHDLAMPLLLETWWKLWAMGLLFLAAAGGKGYLAWKNSAKRVGRLMDEKLAASKNRLETSAELTQASDPLAVAQRQETSDYLARNPARRRSHALALALACCAALLVLNGTVAVKFFSLIQISKELALAATKKPEPPKPKAAARDPYAKIDIVAPESQMRATPIEEVVVKGDADSDHGFSAVSLQASVNGGPDHAVPVDPAAFNKGGEIKFDQSLLLDEMNAQPYDVVSYYLEGTSIHPQPLKVSSQMQFIEIRPFREDVLKMPSGTPLPGFSKLMWLINQQINLSKRTWVIANDQLPPSDPVIVKETSATGDQQDLIAGKTHELYQLWVEKEFPAEIIDHIQQAEQAMHLAVDTIRKPALPEARPHQQKALGELVAATKTLMKFFALPKGSLPPGQPDPFKDKQKLAMDPMAARKNAAARLHKLIKREQDIVQQMASTSSEQNQAQDPPDAPPKPAAPSKSQDPAKDQSSPGQDSSQNEPQTAQSPPSPGSSPSQQGQETAQDPSPGEGSPSEPGSGKESPEQLAQEQAKISQELAEMQNDTDAPASSSPAIAEAKQAAQKSANDLAANDKNSALNNARAADAAMLRAEAAMKVEAEQNMREALAQAQQQLQDAAEQERKAASPHDQAQVKAAAEAAHDALVQQQDSQTREGDLQLAKRAGDLAAQFDKIGLTQKLAQLGGQTVVNGPDEGLVDNLNKMADQLSAERLAMQSETQNLEDILKRVDRVQHAAFSTQSAHPGGHKEEYVRELRLNLKAALTDAKVLLPSGIAVDKTLSLLPSPVATTVDFQPLREPLAAFRLEIEQRLEYLRSQTTLSHLDPDQSPEEYRALVAAYYERISREAKAVDPHAQP